MVVAAVVVKREVRVINQQSPSKHFNDWLRLKVYLRSCRAFVSSINPISSSAADAALYLAPIWTSDDLDAVDYTSWSRLRH